MVFEFSYNKNEELELKECRFGFTPSLLIKEDVESVLKTLQQIFGNDYYVNESDYSKQVDIGVYHWRNYILEIETGPTAYHIFPPVKVSDGSYSWIGVRQPYFTIFLFSE
jgi:hypothetical protein